MRRMVHRPQFSLQITLDFYGKSLKLPYGWSMEKTEGGEMARHQRLLNGLGRPEEIIR